MIKKLFLMLTIMPIISFPALVPTAARLLRTVGPCVLAVRPFHGATRNEEISSRRFEDRYGRLKEALERRQQLEQEQCAFARECALQHESLRVEIGALTGQLLQNVPKKLSEDATPALKALHSQLQQSQELQQKCGVIQQGTKRASELMMSAFVAAPTGTYVWKASSEMIAYFMEHGMTTHLSDAPFIAAVTALYYTSPLFVGAVASWIASGLADSVQRSAKQQQTAYIAAIVPEISKEKHD